MRSTWLAACVAAVLVGVSAPAAAEQREIKNVPDYRHTRTATPFPLKAGEFSRTKIIEYNADGSDASASYDLVRGDKKLVSVTVYIYPMDSSGNGRSAACTGEYVGIKEAIDDAYKSVTLVKEDTPGTPSPRNKADGKHASYTLTGNFAGTEMPLRSEAYLYCPPAGKWYVQYRATWPKGADYEREVFALMAAIPWSDTLAR